ncbi:MAG: UDP-3-O-(3-hydroxymyristoyl)glucosamine N-acyltransferase [Flavobacteriaceae bacterium]|jgi:UDP-3-O-[3-hydroxymyristoyl] glucosamine N-acyltransferase|nr:UDP-3-O-(3-hydroxymyristoyl)glucosamine N-acyltransferase [Flavobacteriaceae bacterium]
MLKEFKCSELAEVVGGKASSGNITIDNISSLDSANASSISFLSDSSYIPRLKETKSKVILIKKEDLKYWGKDYILVKNPYLAFSKIATLFNELGENGKYSIHESVVFGNNSKPEENNSIRAHSTIGDNCLLGKDIQIGSNVTVGDNVVIGSNTVIHSNVTIESNVKIGANCVFFSGSRIGTDGFGYAPDDDGSWAKIPQTGGVIIEDNVHIGANTTIDCGAIDNTIIKTGVKIDNLVHIAHNCVIGENTIIAAMAGFAGSSKIGKACMIGGGARIGPNISIADRTVISPTTPIARSIKKEGQRFTGAVPPLNHKDWLKFAVKFMIRKGMK